MTRSMRRSVGWCAATAALGVLGLSLAAQVPAGDAAPGAQAPAAGRGGPGGGRGRGGAVNPGGGSQLNDPLYADVDFSKKPPLLPLTPEEELKRFILQPGYRMELVLSDPDIQDPTAIAFDGNGRMFVLEDRGYMQDADATNELAPVGRVSVHEDTNNDGIYDKHSVFVDNLVFPRFLTPFGPNVLLTKESHAQEVWKYTDTNGDGVADKKELFDTGYGRLGNIEHEESHFTWALDNWMYSTFNAFRARWTPNGVIKEPIGSGGAQWGLVQDNDGKIWFQGGASGMPGYFQFPIVYGNFGPADTVDPELRTPWGAPVRIADMQGGLGSTRMPDGSLAGTTAGAGGDIYRGDRLPKDLIGEYLYGEEVARIVRRVHPENREGLTYIKNAYLYNEFIKSTDPYFRPVDQITAPDGTEYIVDMYHGIIQQATWTPKGSYLRARIEQYDLDKVIHHGRIWRLVYDGVKPDKSDTLTRDKTMPRMNSETPAELVAHLSHPNGWWRDTAQQLLVLKQDKSVVPALQAIVKTSPNLLGRFHAMWTLEGLGALDATLVRQEMKDPEPRMRIQAIRASETLYKAGDKSFAADYKAFTKDPSVDVAVQSMLTMNKWKVADANAAIKAAQDTNKARGVQVVAEAILNPASGGGGRGGPGGPGGGGGAPTFTAAQRIVLDRGGQIYNELCFSCHGNDGLGAPKAETGSTMAPPLAGSPRVNGHRDYIIKAVLLGLTGPIDGKSYTDVMIPNNTNNDEWVASVASYVRSSFGNNAGLVTPADVARVRAATTDRKTLWKVDELSASIPRQLINNGWKATASHNGAAAVGALSMTSWSTATAQQPGMWFQVELPTRATITELQFDSPSSGRGGGGGGRGAAGAAGGAPAPAPPPPVMGYPRGYRVETSMDGTSWKSAAEGKGDGTNTTVTFAPVQARFVRLTQTGTADGTAPPWTMQNLRLFEPGR